MSAIDDVWNLQPAALYLLDGDEQVRALMVQLGVPNLFAGAVEFDAIKALVAFDNHPTHWIILRLWKGAPDYSPNHGIHRFVKSASPNGLMFQATPKPSASRAKMEIELERELREMEATAPFSWRQLPQL